LGLNKNRGETGGREEAMKRLSGFLKLLMVGIIMNVCGYVSFGMDKPSILFCSPMGCRGGHLTLQYVKELYQKGFDVDYIEDDEEFFKLDYERISKYNVVVLFVSPGRLKLSCSESIYDELSKKFRKMIEEYVSKGGGVLLMPEERNVFKQMLIEVTALFGVQIANELIEESNDKFKGKLSNASYDVPLQYTDNVVSSPVSEGVSGMWYPSGRYYNGAFANPIVVDENWKEVIKASKTAKTRPVEKQKTNFGYHIEGVPRRNGVESPLLVAIREYKNGRVAIFSMAPQFTVGAGTQFIYNREVLSNGIKGKRSDAEKLLDNIYRWLAEPSMKSGVVGGYRTRDDALIGGNYRKLTRGKTEYWKHGVAGRYSPPLEGIYIKD
jgi:hypothetical protein